jgi:hypothetical protein
MSAEPSTLTEEQAKQLRGLQFVSLGLIAGPGIMAVFVILSLVVAFQGRGVLDDDELRPIVGYGSLLLVPLALILAFQIWPAISRATPVEPTVPAFTAQFLPKAALLEGPAMMMLMLFLISGFWPILFGVAVLMAALVFLFPTEAKYRAWADEFRTER